MVAKTCNLLYEIHLNMILDHSFSKLPALIFGGRIAQLDSRGKFIWDSFIRFNEKLPLIIPNSHFYIFWHIISMCAIICNLFIFTIDLVMGEKDMYQYYDIKWTGFNIVIFFLYIFDIIVKFNTQIYAKGFIWKKKSQIAIQYSQTQLIYDIIVLLPFILEISHIKYPFKFWNLLVYLKIGTYKNIVNNVSNQIISNKALTHILSIIRLVLFICFVAHIFGCAWQGLATLSKELNWDVPTWIETKGKENSHWLEIYIWTFYFAITTMTTIGYGDITPANVYEACLLVAGMVIATFTFAVTFNAIGSIVQELQKDYNEYLNELQLVNLYLQSKHCSEELGYEVQQYLEMKYKESKTLTNEEQKFVISKLPDNIQQQIIFESFVHILDHNKNLFGQFSIPCQIEIASRFKEINVEKGQIIFIDQNQDDGMFEEKENPCFYHVESGQVTLYMGNRYNLDKNNLGVFKKDNYFGEFSFFSGQQRECCAQVTKKGILNYIKRSDFIDALQNFPFDYEIFCMNKDRIVYNKSNVILDIECKSCKKLGHYVKDCPLLHYKPDKEKIILKYKYSDSQNRSNVYMRNTLIQWNAVLDLNYIQQKRQQVYSYFKNNQFKTLNYQNEDISPNQIQDKVSQMSEQEHDDGLEDDFQELDDQFNQKIVEKKTKTKIKQPDKNSLQDQNIIQSFEHKNMKIPLKFQKIQMKENLIQQNHENDDSQKQNKLSFLVKNKKQLYGNKIFQQQDVSRLHSISNKSQYEIDEFEEPVIFKNYYPTYNFDVQNIVNQYFQNKEKYIKNYSFGIYTLYNRKILKQGKKKVREPKRFSIFTKQD